MKKILGLPMVDHTINAALKSVQYINRFTNRSGVRAEVYMLIPEGDPLKEHLEGKPNIVVHEGPEMDLVTRFNGAVEKTNADYIVRITADCPLLPPFLVTKCINTAIKNEYDFLDTANPSHRCFFDGGDVEVMSRKMFNWLNENATEREHVCNDIRTKCPDWAKLGHIFSYLDLSAFKLSVDTQEDFDLVANQMKSVQNKKRRWEETHGRYSAHLF
jgi:spore coat polysaccharide biosynthesis protein SpsF (cytidylyltransferase family)